MLLSSYFAPDVEKTITYLPDEHFQSAQSGLTVLLVIGMRDTSTRHDWETDLYLDLEKQPSKGCTDQSIADEKQKRTFENNSGKQSFKQYCLRLYASQLDKHGTDCHVIGMPGQ